MGTAELTEWIKWFLIIFVAVIVSWEKAKRWYYGRGKKDRRSTNPNLELKVIKLCQAFKDHEKHDDQRTEEIKAELKHFREEQGRHSVSIGVLKSRLNSK